MRGCAPWGGVETTHDRLRDRCESAAPGCGSADSRQPIERSSPDLRTRLIAVDDACGYLDLRDLFVSQAGSIDLTAGVPACPGWDVHDLIAHQVHQVSSACDGSFPVQDALEAIVGVEPDRRRQARTRQDRWVAGGVAARRGVPIADVIAEWDALAPSAPTAALAGLFPDLAVHFFDLLGSVGRMGHRAEPFVVPALRFWARNSDTRLEQAGRGPLRLEFAETSGSVDPIGRVDARMVVAGTPFRAVALDRRAPQPKASRRAAMGRRR